MSTDDILLLLARQARRTDPFVGFGKMFPSPWTVVFAFTKSDSGRGAGAIGGGCDNFPRFVFGVTSTWSIGVNTVRVRLQS